MSAESLRVQVPATPWGMAFTDQTGNPVLTEGPGAGLGGTLGFRMAGVWYPATGVRSARYDEATAGYGSARRASCRADGR